MILPVLMKLNKSLSVSDNDSYLVKAVKTAALGNLNTRYIDENLNLHLFVCTLLDPRYKDMLIDDDTKTEAINSIVCHVVCPAGLRVLRHTSRWCPQLACKCQLRNQLAWICIPGDHVQSKVIDILNSSKLSLLLLYLVKAFYLKSVSQNCLNSPNYNLLSSAIINRLSIETTGQIIDWHFDFD